MTVSPADPRFELIRDNPPPTASAAPGPVPRLVLAPDLTPEEEIEALEIAALDEGVESLSDFIRRVSPELPPPAHLAPLIALIERARREVVRAVVSFPPRHAKTTTIEHGFAWWLAESPADTHAYVSYNDQQALSKSGPTRALALKAGVQLRADATGKSEWRTVQGGGLLAAGIGGPLTGQGVSGLLVVDDPIKNYQESCSKTVRDEVWDWFTSVALTRSEGASVIVVMTRWNEDDLAGRLAATGEWEIMNMPAVATGVGEDPLGRAAGEALWPERYPTATCTNRGCTHAGHLDDIRKTIGAFMFMSLYQGAPRPRGLGDGMFQRTEATMIDAVPADVSEWVRRWDLAASEPTAEYRDPDWTVGVLMGRRRNGKYVIADVVFIRKRADEVRKTILRTAKNDGRRVKVGIPKDPGQAGKDQAASFVKLLAGFSVFAEAETGDKTVRAEPLSAQWQAGNVEILKSQLWNQEFFEQMEGFPRAGFHDDAVDASAGAFKKLAKPMSMFDPAVVGRQVPTS